MKLYVVLGIWLIVFPPQDAASVREEDIMKAWAEKLGDELWELGVTVTKSQEIRQSYTKLNARVLETDGDGILKNIVSNLGRLLRQKMNSVMCLIRKAEELSLMNTTEIVQNSNYSYYSSLHSPVMEESGAVKYFSKKNHSHKQMELSDIEDFFGINVNVSHSSVYVPIDVHDKGSDVLSALYWSEGLDGIFRSNFQSDSTISWQYFCSSSGFLRHYPAFHWEHEDELFDCRNRFWFIEATTCSKDVVILIDHSGSMNDIRKTLAKVTVRSLLDTFNSNDYFNIFTFNKTMNQVVPCYSFDTLVQATPENVNMFKESLDGTEPEDKVNLTYAFIKAFDILEEVRKEKNKNCSEGECCQMIILVTDGVADNITDVFEKHNWFENKTRVPVRVMVFVVGREGGSVEGARQLSCQNRGYCGHIRYLEELKLEIIRYLMTLARPFVYQGVQHPLAWTNIFIDDTADMSKESDISKRMTSVSGPIFDLRTEKEEKDERDFNLLGVAGTDLLVSEIEKLALPYKIGANGYAFLLSNNGYLMFHPDHRPKEDGVLKENYNSVDLTEVELYDDDETKPRLPNENVLKLREALINREETTMLNMKMKFHYDKMRRVGVEIRNYYLAPLNNTPFSLGLVLPYSYGSYWIKAGDEIRKSIQMGIPLIEHFQGNWKINPKWVYCDYHRQIHWFTSPEEKLTHFLEKMFDIKNWKWLEQLPAEVEDLTDDEVFNEEKCHREPIKEDAYYCDKDLMQLLVFDAKVTENIYKDMKWSASDRREEELVEQFDVSVRFVATQSGLTRWQHVHDLPEGSRSFGESSYMSLEESWYKSAVLFHHIDPEAFVFSVPFNAGLFPDYLVTASHAIFPRDGGHEAPGSVVGFQMKHSTLFDIFMDITSKSQCRDCSETCWSDTLDCYVIDSNGYIIISEIGNDTGRFFGEIEGAVMEKMVSKDIFRRIPMFDYQGVCFVETLISNAVEGLMTPFVLVKNLLFWLLTRVVWLISLQVEQLFPVYAQLYDDYDENFELFNEKTSSNEKNAEPLDQFEFIPETCDKFGFLYMLQPERLEHDASTTLNCSRPFYVKRVPRTNLLLVVVNTLHQSCYRKLSSRMERIVYPNSYSQHPGCQKLYLNDLPRKTKTCFSYHPKEEEILACAGGNSLPVHKYIMLISLIILLI